MDAVLMKDREVLKEGISQRWAGKREEALQFIRLSLDKKKTFLYSAGMEISCANLIYDYPEHLIATQPRDDFRTLLYEDGQLNEISKSEIFELFSPGDLLVLNDTKVTKCRIFTECGLEILFVNELEDNVWEVLFPLKRMKQNKVYLPNGVSFEVVEKGLPQKIKVSQKLDEEYFSEYGELALPPYIQKARGQRNNLTNDEDWYQTSWAKQFGSTAAPTASLHFSQSDLDVIRNRGVSIEFVTLHVGLGTFLPIKTEKLKDHKMHAEYCEIPISVKEKIEFTKANKARVWALGTTVTRALESIYTHHLQQSFDKLVGRTDLFITPGFRFKAVDVLMTNFHQPGSTLLALVAAFVGLEEALSSYHWAVEKEFRLFSYGDFCIWKK